jgi:hypothetical protein
MTRIPIPVDKVRERLHYDPETGIFRWKTGNTWRGDDVAGAVNDRGYVQIALDGILYYGHRVAWAHYYGEQPPPLLDHWDRNRQNNSIKNLRAATPSQSNANRKGRNNGLPKGVYRTKSGKFTARVGVRNSRPHLGMFDTPEEARQVYQNRMKELFGEYVGGE